MVTQSNSDPLSRVFAALADPTRRAMLTRLKDGDATVAELATPFAISRPAISRHLRVLEQAGLIRRTKDKQWRRIHIVADALKTAEDWLREYEVFWKDRFDALEQHLASEDSPPSKGEPHDDSEQ